VTEPHLSVVATSRNDNHGIRPLDRMQLFVDGLAEQADRMGTMLELIVVEWNPPSDRAPLADAVRWPRGHYFVPRIITVPAEVHRRLPHSDSLPLFQMIAKNVGIRRAAAPFVLATNIDILLADELFAYLTRSLKPQAMYRVDRRDVRVPWELSPTAAEVRRLPSLRDHRIDRTHLPGDQPISSGGGPGVTSPRRIAHAVLDRITLPRLHTNGCGDFTLAARELWDSIRGYPEWPYFSWHLDGLPLYQAYAMGAEMVNLEDPMVAIHIEHSAGSGWTPEGASTLFQRLDRDGVPYLDTREYHRLARKVVRGGRASTPFNGPDWGLATVELPTTSLSSTS
jgi:hypothetical protein